MQSLHPLKVSAIVREHCQPVVQPGGGDQEIEIADELSCSSQPSAFSAEDFAGVLIDADDLHAAKKIVQILLIALRIGGVVDTLVELSQGDDRES